MKVVELFEDTIADSRCKFRLTSDNAIRGSSNPVGLIPTKDLEKFKKELADEISKNFYDSTTVIDAISGIAISLPFESKFTKQDGDELLNKVTEICVEKVNKFAYDKISVDDIKFDTAIYCINLPNYHIEYPFIKLRFLKDSDITGIEKLFKADCLKITNFQHITGGVLSLFKLDVKELLMQGIPSITFKEVTDTICQFFNNGKQVAKCQTWLMRNGYKHLAKY